ncbi:hypothetical protein JB92DRAFT_2935239 [Gautieria morchelliformis]|nr:hypothetical protein JB92DRAFT_2935239 [Gautieria morchelliformis]
MANVPESTWRKIFSFVLFGCRDPPGAEGFEASSAHLALWTKKKRIENVCRSWRRIVQILTIKTPIILLDSDLVALSAFISADEQRGSEVELFSLKHMPNSRLNKGGHPDVGLICSLIPHLKQLRYFEGCPSISLPVSAVKRILCSTGKTLISFGNMRLSWDDASGQFSRRRDFPFLKKHALPSLQTVIFLQVSYLELKFLDKYGSKITHLDLSIDITSDGYRDEQVDLLRNCSALKTLTLRKDVGTVGYPQFLKATGGNKSLEKIEILGDNGRWRWKKPSDFVQDLRLELFPKLREIRFSSFKWPNTYHEIERHHLVKLSRKLKLDTGGRIGVTDESGKPFRERVQPRT